MDLNKLTHPSQQALAKAVEIARDKRNPQVDSFHLLLSLLSDFPE